MVVDDHPMWRDGIVRDLDGSPYEVVAEAGDGAQALRLAAATRPELVVLDLRLPDIGGVAVIRGLLSLNPEIRILMLSASGEYQDVLDAVKAGASGYLLKSAGAAEFREALDRTVLGEPVFTPGLAGLVLGEFRRLAAETPKPSADTPRLTRRETEVLRLVASGLSYRQIAQRLTLSHRTVQNHVQNTLNKLQLHNRVELARYAIREGLGDEV
jgi:DNA-binding NarL/FixJ family response regulator